MTEGVKLLAKEFSRILILIQISRPLTLPGPKDMGFLTSTIIVAMIHGYNVKKDIVAMTHG